ncbi:MAG: VIT1/CCC1 transporter family protein [Phycisphaerales bacterium]|nr:VIT1/CCC1 transporter family protein [Phycisphaerales bacterium]MCI0631412.1 VIT1/CCC1 transporter family protein [Phycisphaerales bacterium]
MSAPTNSNSVAPRDEHSVAEPKGLLDPIERVSEILFGLIMVLTFTGSLSVAQAGEQEIRTMLIGAIGCNLAWGIVDAAMYLMTRLTERGRGMLSIRAVRHANNAKYADRIIADALPRVVASVLRPEEIESIRQRVRALPEPPGGTRPRLGRDDWFAAVAVFAWVFVSTFPVVLPFMFMHNATLALRVSNGIAIVMLFLVGWSLGRHAGQQPWRMGLAMVFIGVVLVALTIALGG